MILRKELLTDMSNIICLNKNASKDEWLSMNNGTTDTFLDMLAAAGSALANTDSEKELIVWLSEHDQNVTGSGTVGFDVADMPWQTAEFEGQKRFLLTVSDTAENGDFSDILPCKPDMTYMKPFFRRFRKIVMKMTAEMVDEANRTEWIAAADENDPVRNGFPRCEHHGILLSVFGCRLCRLR